MSPLHHRAPGVVGAVLLNDRVTAGIIVDGVHAHAASVQLALRIKGPERLALVTDAFAAAGATPGRYALGDQEVTVDGASARLADGTLAGSVLTLDRAVRNLVQTAGATVAEALRMASETPAALLGLADRGRLAAGALADVVLLDAGLCVETTIVRGAIHYARPR
jgi:N-acetylglucosamine-6-phosphate deacetylase